MTLRKKIFSEDEETIFDEVVIYKNCNKLDLRFVKQHWRSE